MSYFADYPGRPMPEWQRWLIIYGTWAAAGFGVLIGVALGLASLMLSYVIKLPFELSHTFFVTDRAFAESMQDRWFTLGNLIAFYNLIYLLALNPFTTLVHVKREYWNQPRTVYFSWYRWLGCTVLAYALARPLFNLHTLVEVWVADQGHLQGLLAPLILLPMLAALALMISISVAWSGYYESVNRDWRKDLNSTDNARTESDVQRLVRA